MADVVVLPCIERRDLGHDTPSPSVLSGAIDQGVTSATVIGIDRQGELYIASAIADPDKVIGQMTRAIAFLANAVIEHETDQGGELG